MNTKTLSNRALSVIDQYLHLTVGSAVAAVPYFNNKTVRSRAALRAFVGKGSPADIAEEVRAIALKNRIHTDSWASEILKKLLVDENLGIDCSGFAYYVLNAESIEEKKGLLDKHLSFVQSHGLFGKFISAVRPVNNTGVITFADDKNSKAILLTEARPGDFVTLLSQSKDSFAADRDHMIVIHQVEYQNFIPYKIHYSHAVAYPEDGVYGSGVRQGTIEILDPSKPILEQRWIENGKAGPDNNLFLKAQKAKVELRRLKWFAM